jgi:hypothetical protein
MRAVQLKFKATGPRKLHVQAPPSGNVAPPGFYYLIVLKKNGDKNVIPSKARVVIVDQNSAGGRAPAPMGM